MPSSRPTLSLWHFHPITRHHSKATRSFPSWRGLHTKRHRQSVPQACTISHWTIVMIMVMNTMISVTWIAGCCIFMIHNHFNDHHPDHPLHRIKQTSLPASYAATVLSHTSSENSWALGQGAGMVIYDDDGVAEYFCIHHHHYQRPSLENVWHRCRCHTWRKLVPREQSPCRKWIFYRSFKKNGVQ